MSSLVVHLSSYDCSRASTSGSSSPPPLPPQCSGMTTPSLWTLGLFLFYGSYVNLNDPDAFFWPPAYGVGGMLSWLCLLQPQVVVAAATTTKAPSLRVLYRFYFVMSLAVAAGSFSLLRSEASIVMNVSGKSGWLGIFELEPVREGGGALIMALAMHLCLSWDRTPKQPTTAGTEGSSSGSSSSTAVNWVLASAPGIVAAIAIYLGVILPQYYTRLGVVIPEHCGGSGGGEAEPEVNPLLQS